MGISAIDNRYAGQSRKYMQKASELLGHATQIRAFGSCLLAAHPLCRQDPPSIRLEKRPLTLCFLSLVSWRRAIRPQTRHRLTKRPLVVLTAVHPAPDYADSNGSIFSYPSSVPANSLQPQSAHAGVYGPKLPQNSTLRTKYVVR